MFICPVVLRLPMPMSLIFILPILIIMLSWQGWMKLKRLVSSFVKQKCLKKWNHNMGASFTCDYCGKVLKAEYDDYEGWAPVEGASYKYRCKPLHFSVVM